jgi:hypothetical protein
MKKVNANFLVKLTKSWMTFFLVSCLFSILYATLGTAKFPPTIEFKALILGGIAGMIILGDTLLYLRKKNVVRYLFFSTTTIILLLFLFLRQTEEGYEVIYFLLGLLLILCSIINFIFIKFVKVSIYSKLILSLVGFLYIFFFLQLIF